MIITRQNFTTIKEVRPTVTFTLSHLDGINRDEVSFKQKKLRCYEILFQATGHTALQILTCGLELSKKLEVIDMYVIYKRGNIIFQILTALPIEDIEEYVRQKGRFYYVYYSLKKTRRNQSLWKTNKSLINEEYDSSPTLQKFVFHLSQNEYLIKSLNLN